MSELLAQCMQFLANPSVIMTKYIRGSMHLFNRFTVPGVFKIIINSDFSVLVLVVYGLQRLTDVPPTFFAALPRDAFVTWLLNSLFGYELSHFAPKIHDSFFGVRDVSRYVLRTVNYGVAMRSGLFVFITMDDVVCTLKNLPMIVYPLMHSEYLAFVNMFEKCYVDYKIKWLRNLVGKYPKRSAQFCDGGLSLYKKLEDVKSLKESLLLSGASLDGVTVVLNDDHSLDDENNKKSNKKTH